MHHLGTRYAQQPHGRPIDEQWRQRISGAAQTATKDHHRCQKGLHDADESKGGVAHTDYRRLIGEESHDLRRCQEEYDTHHGHEDGSDAEAEEGIFFGSLVVLRPESLPDQCGGSHGEAQPGMKEIDSPLSAIW
jgi:hypothetical protein